MTYRLWIVESCLIAVVGIVYVYDSQYGGAGTVLIGTWTLLFGVGVHNIGVVLLGTANVTVQTVSITTGVMVSVSAAMIGVGLVQQIVEESALGRITLVPRPPWQRPLVAVLRIVLVTLCSMSLWLHIQ